MPSKVVAFFVSEIRGPGLGQDFADPPAIFEAVNAHKKYLKFEVEMGYYANNE